MEWNSQSILKKSSYLLDWRLTIELNNLDWYSLKFCSLLIWNYVTQDWTFNVCTYVVCIEIVDASSFQTVSFWFQRIPSDLRRVLSGNQNSRRVRTGSVLSVCRHDASKGLHRSEANLAGGQNWRRAAVCRVSEDTQVLRTTNWYSPKIIPRWKKNILECISDLEAFLQPSAN